MNRLTQRPFRFCTRQNLTYLTGRKARNISELLEGIKQARDSSIYHHTHHYLQQHEFLSPEPPNDFAYWIRNVLQEEVLGEQVGSVDLREFNSVQAIRVRIVEVIEQYLESNPEMVKRNVPTGLEFHFREAQSFVIPTKYMARNLQEFRECLEHVTIFSIYYHMFEARLRLEREMSDFTAWLHNELNEKELADQFLHLDPYTHTLENLRKKLVDLVAQRLLEEKNYGKVARL